MLSAAQFCLSNLKLRCGSALTPHVSRIARSYLVPSINDLKWRRPPTNTKVVAHLHFLFVPQRGHFSPLFVFVSFVSTKKPCVYQQNLFLELPVIFVKSFSSGETDPHSCWQTVFLPIFAGSTLTRYPPSHFLPLRIPSPNWLLFHRRRS